MVGGGIKEHRTLNTVALTQGTTTSVARLYPPLARLPSLHSEEKERKAICRQARICVARREVCHKYKYRVNWRRTQTVVVSLGTSL